MKVVLQGVLGENFVLSLINSMEIQVKYNIDNEMCNWKAKMESDLGDILENFFSEIKANFKGKDQTPGLFKSSK